MHALTATHRRQLLALRAQTIRDLLVLWPAFDPNDRATWPRFAGPAALLIKQRRAVAAALASRYYEELRAARGVRGRIVIEPEPVPDALLATSLAATGLAGTFNALGAGRTLEQARRNGFVRIGMASGRHVLNGSRDTLTNAAALDGRSRGWTRITDGSACSWCSQLAGEHSREDAFAAHDGCGCTAEPNW